MWQQSLFPLDWLNQLHKPNDATVFYHKLNPWSVHLDVRPFCDFHVGASSYLPISTSCLFATQERDKA